MHRGETRHNNTQVNPNQRLIKRLEKPSLIQDYKLLDPVYQQAAKKLRIHTTQHS